MGRPRKYPKVIVENGEITESQNNNSIVTSEPKVKKKRGRKPKIRTPEELSLLSQVGKKKEVENQKRNLILKQKIVIMVLLLMKQNLLLLDYQLIQMILKI